MKVTAHVEVVGAGRAYEEAFSALQRLGAQGVELVMKEGAALNLHTANDELRRIRQLAENCGLSISGLTSGYSWTLPMTSDDPRVRSAGEKAMERVLEAASLLGTDSLLITPGYARTDFVTPSETIPPATALERAVEGVRKAAAYGAACQVSVNVEVVWGGMLRSPEEMLGFLQTVDSPWAGFYMDTGNVYPEGEPLGWIKVLGSHIGRVHMKDFQPALGGMEAFCRLGDGKVDFAGVIQALRAVGYDGWIGAEHHHSRTEAAAGHSISFLKRLAQ